MKGQFHSLLKRYVTGIEFVTLYVTFSSEYRCRGSSTSSVPAVAITKHYITIVSLLQICLFQFRTIKILLCGALPLSVPCKE